MSENSDARRAAAAEGRKTYQISTPCKRGHLSLRQTTNGGCIECMRLVVNGPEPAVKNGMGVAFQWAHTVPVGTSEAQKVELWNHLYACAHDFLSRQQPPIEHASLAFKYLQLIPEANKRGKRVTEFFK